MLPSKGMSKRTFFKTSLAATASAFAHLKSTFADVRSDSHVYGNQKPFRFCFGSCHLHGAAQDHWGKIDQRNPDLWLWLGDNIYANTRNADVIAAKYNTVLIGPYGDFRQKYEIDGIWDDHDFGEDNANRDYPLKEISQKLHLDFLGVSETDPRRDTKGIYHTREEANGRIKFFFLDCRYYKDPKKGRGYDLLGEEQWQWLEREIENSTADVNIFITPIGILLNRFFVTEDWAEYPHEKERLLAKIQECRLSGVFFMSGDKHFGAFIKREHEVNGEKVEFHEFQSSGMTHTPGKSLLKVIGKLYGKKNCLLERNFAEVNITFEKGLTHMMWSLRSLEGRNLKTRNFYLDSDNRWIKA